MITQEAALKRAVAEQYIRAYERFRKHFRQELLDAVMETRRYDVTMAAQALCGDPYARISTDESWDDAETAFLAAFAD